MAQADVEQDDHRQDSEDKTCRDFGKIVVAVAANDWLTRQVNVVIRVLVLFRNRLNPVEKFLVIQSLFIK